MRRSPSALGGIKEFVEQLYIRDRSIKKGLSLQTDAGMSKVETAKVKTKIY